MNQQRFHCEVLHRESQRLLISKSRLREGVFRRSQLYHTLFDIRGTLIVLLRALFYTGDLCNAFVQRRANIEEGWLLFCLIIRYSFLNFYTPRRAYYHYLYRLDKEETSTTMRGRKYTGSRRQTPCNHKYPVEASSYP